MKIYSKHLRWNAIISMVVIICVWFSANAQHPKGIYKSEDDFSINKLSFVTCKIRVNEFSPGSNVKVKCDSETYYLSKDSLYGYLDDNNKAYRFYMHELYSLINYGEEIQLYKIHLSNHVKNDDGVDVYYFSKNYSGKIFPLSIPNILKEFEDNIAFTDLVEIHFKKDNELMEYDSYHKKYKLNRLLELSIIRK